MSALLRDIRLAFRVMRRSLGFTIVAIMTLALGIGANSALFSVVNAVFLQPLGYPEPERLVLLWGTTPNIPKEEASLPDYTDWKAQSRSFDGMAAARFINANITGEGEPERVIRAGEAFWEPGGDVIHYQDGNNRTDAWVRFVVTMLCVPGKPMLALVDDAELARRRNRRAARPA